MNQEKIKDPIEEIEENLKKSDVIVSNFASKMVAGQKMDETTWMLLESTIDIQNLLKLVKTYEIIMSQTSEQRDIDFANQRKKQIFQKG